MRRNPKGTKTTGLQRAKFGLPAVDDLVTPEPAPQKLVNDKVPRSFVTRVTPHLSEGDVHSIFFKQRFDFTFRGSALPADLGNSRSALRGLADS